MNVFPLFYPGWSDKNNYKVFASVILGVKYVLVPWIICSFHKSIKSERIVMYYTWSCNIFYWSCICTVKRWKNHFFSFGFEKKSYGKLWCLIFSSKLLSLCEQSSRIIDSVSNTHRRCWKLTDSHKIQSNTVIRT